MSGKYTDAQRELSNLSKVTHLLNSYLNSDFLFWLRLNSSSIEILSLLTNNHRKLPWRVWPTNLMNGYSLNNLDIKSYSAFTKSKLIPRSYCSWFICRTKIKWWYEKSASVLHFPSKQRVALKLFKKVDRCFKIIQPVLSREKQTPHSIYFTSTC